MAQNRLRINFVGNYSSNYVGEISDESHLVRELEKQGHTVQKVPRDIWKAVVDGEYNEDWLDRLPNTAVDINIVCKWNHFNNEEYINALRVFTNAPVLYWVWDFMQNEDWHMRLVEACDLYIANDVYSGNYNHLKNCHYFPFDVADGTIQAQWGFDKTYDVAFFGTKLGQGDRVEWLVELNKHTPVTVFSWNYEEWQSLGFTAYPAVYGKDFARAVEQSKVIIGFNVEDHTWGYWSNRVGKVMLLGGCLLYRYVPGMELFLRDGAEYFSSKEEMVEKVQWLLENENERTRLKARAHQLGKERFSSRERIKDLVILIDRFLKGGF